MAGRVILFASGYALFSIFAGIFCISADSVSDFNQIPLEQLPGYFERDPALFAKQDYGNVNNRERALNNLADMVKKYPYMKEYMRNTLTVFEISNKYPLLPAQYIAEKTAELSEENRKKGSEVTAVTAKILKEFDKAASDAVNENYKRMMSGINFEEVSAAAQGKASNKRAEILRSQ